MSEDRPRLLLLGGPHIDAEAIGPELHELFEIVESTPAEAMRTIDGCQVVLAEAGDFVALERDLVGRQSALLLNAISESVALCDPQGRVLWANQMLRALDPHVIKRVGEVVSHAFEVFAAVTEGQRDGVQLRTKTYKFVHKMTRQHFEVRVTPVAAQAGEPGEPARIAQAAVVVRNITAKARNEKRLDAIARAGRELAHIDADDVRSLHAAERLRELELRVRRHMTELLHYDHFAVRMVEKRRPDDDSPARMPVVMACGIPDEYQAIELRQSEEGNGISGLVAATGRSIICDDCSESELYVDGLHHPGSSLTVPLRAHDKLVGVLNIESSEVGSFSKNDLRAAEIFAGYLATALHTLDLLVTERVETNKATSGAVRGELSAPLNDLCAEVALLREEANGDPRTIAHLDRIMRDVESMRRRMTAVSRGHNTLLGADTAVEAARIDPRLQGKRVLVVDNESEIRDMIRDLLAAVGCDVVTCEDGTSAVRTLATQRFDGAGDAPGATEPFDLVLSDIGLDDLTGYDVFSAAKKAAESVPVILITGFGYDPHHSIVKASQEGLQAVLFKPFQASRLIEEVRSAIAPSD